MLNSMNISLPEHREGELPQSQTEAECQNHSSQTLFEEAVFLLVMRQSTCLPVPCVRYLQWSRDLYSRETARPKIVLSSHSTRKCQGQKCIQLVCRPN